RRRGVALLLRQRSHVSSACVDRDPSGHRVCDAVRRHAEHRAAAGDPSRAAHDARACRSVPAFRAERRSHLRGAHLLAGRAAAGRVGPRGRPLRAEAGELPGFYAVNAGENVFSRRFGVFAALMPPAGMEGERAALMERLHLPQYIPQGEVVVRADSPNLRLLDLLGTRFIVEGPGATFRSDSAPERFELVYDGEGVRIYRNAEAFPRAFLVHRAEVVAEPGRALERLVSPDFDPRTTALLERQPLLRLSGAQTDEPAG